MPSRLWSHICDYAHLNEYGNAIIIGDFDRMYAPAVPLNTHLFFIIDKWVGTPLETFSHFVRIIAPSRQTIWASPVDHITIPVDGYATGAHTFVTASMNTIFPELGEYAIEFVIDDIPVHLMPLTLLPVYLQPDPEPPVY